MFTCWVKAVLKKRFRIISLVKKRNSRYLKKTHKYGIEVPKYISQAYDLDKKIDSTLWEYSIAKDMNDVSPAFKILDNDAIIPI